MAMANIKAVQTVEYIQTHLKEMARLSRDEEELTTLAYLLGLAELEAAEICHAPRSRHTKPSSP